MEIAEKEAAAAAKYQAELKQAKVELADCNSKLSERNLKIAELTQVITDLHKEIELMVVGYTKLGEIYELFNDFPVYGCMDKIGETAVATVRGYLGLVPPDFGGNVLSEEFDDHIQAHVKAYAWHQPFVNRQELSGHAISTVIKWKHWASASVSGARNVPILCYPEFLAWHDNFDPPYPGLQFEESLVWEHFELTKSALWPSDLEVASFAACKDGLKAWRNRVNKFVLLLDKFFQWFSSTTPALVEVRRQCLNRD